MIKEFICTIFLSLIMLFISIYFGFDLIKMIFSEKIFQYIAACAYCIIIIGPIIAISNLLCIKKFLNDEWWKKFMKGVKNEFR